MSSPLPPPLPLDPSRYNLQDNALAFFKEQTGIHDEENLRDHILGVQAEAYAVHPYPCIRCFRFTTLKISQFPTYDAVLNIGKEKPGSILLDLGCCFGNDTRKAIADGYPRDSVIASDLRPEFWKLGHKLFRSSPETFPVPFLAGDVFDPKFLAPDTPPAPSSSTSPHPAPPLTRVTTLTQLQHYVAVIHTSSFFHLFTESQQHALAHRLGSLLSPLPGSMIFGSHVGIQDTAENREGGARITERGITVFTHSPASWEKLWVGEGGVFKPGDVVLSTEARKVEGRDIVLIGGDPADGAFLLVWSVTRA